MSETKKLSIIAFSGDFDKLTAVFTLGTGAAAVGYEVNIFFTFDLYDGGVDMDPILDIIRLKIRPDASMAN